MRRRESRWDSLSGRQEDLEFADQWDEAIENAVDAVENVIYQRATPPIFRGWIFCIRGVHEYQRPERAR